MLHGRQRVGATETCRKRVEVAHRLAAALIAIAPELTTGRRELAPDELERLLLLARQAWDNAIRRPPRRGRAAACEGASEVGPR